MDRAIRSFHHPVKESGKNLIDLNLIDLVTLQNQDEIYWGECDLT